MPKINKIKGRQVFDSRGNPTVEAEVHLDDGSHASAIVSSGASTGTHEAFEMRDKEDQSYLGKSVLTAVENINNKISKALLGLSVLGSNPEDEYYETKNVHLQSVIDKILIELDNTKQKKNLGANAILSVSIAACKVAAIHRKIPLYKHLEEHINGIYEDHIDETIPNWPLLRGFTMPIPLMNVINGGVHANNSLRIQEFMIRPEKPKNFKHAMNICFLVIQQLKNILNNNNHITTVGDEGGFAPSLSNNEQAIEFILKAIEKAKFIPGEDVSICLDVAANELFKDKKYAVKSSKFISAEETINYYLELISKYPIKSIEDPFQEDDWDAWTEFNKSLKNKNKNNIQIVGDDLFVTNKERLTKILGIHLGEGYESQGYLGDIISAKKTGKEIANTILIKPNQIGTISETLDVIAMANALGLETIISHRSGDSEDTFIADLAVGTNSSQIKTGSLARSERVSKYNRLLRIEEELGNSAKMAKI
ncbi:MAG: phosphopyruvate hydratase [SAR202 cluster bacterium]|nr:phosphopyruvate hydratase [SAR202 cluster bacterium]